MVTLTPIPAEIDTRSHDPYPSQPRVKLLQVILVFVVPMAVARAEVPDFFRKAHFNAATFAEAVNHYIALGEGPAIRELTALGPESGAIFKPRRGNASLRVEDGVDVPGRIGLMCRVLFQPTGKLLPLREPLYGGLALPREMRRSKDWPLYPVAASGRSYFVLEEGYTLAGVAEEPAAYLAYCHDHGIFRRSPVPVPTRAQAQADALALRKSSAWKALQWSYRSPNESYDLDEAATFWFIQDQADSIPK
jgi:hypothetical protein